MRLYPPSGMKRILSVNIEIASVLMLEKEDDERPGGIAKYDYLIIFFIIPNKMTKFYYS